MLGALHKHAAKVRAAGRFTDDQLVHMSSREVGKLKQMWGEPTINPVTGLPEYFLGDIIDGIGNVVGGIAGGIGDLFGGGSSGGGSWINDIVGVASSLLGGLGGGQQAPTMGGPTTYGNGPSMKAPGDSGGSGSGFDLRKILNLAGGLASFVGALNRNNSWNNYQKKLQKQQQRQNQEWNQHVNYPIGQGNVTYRPPAVPSELYGLGPATAQVQYAHGGRTASAGMRAPMGALSKPQGRIPGLGTGQSDDVPALLSKDEYVIPADVVSHWGDGSSEAGAKKFDSLVKHTRIHRTGNSKFPKSTGGLNQMRKMMGRAA